MKRKYVQPKVDIINLSSTTEFLAGSTDGTATDDVVGDGNDGLEDADGNTISYYGEYQWLQAK